MGTLEAHEIELYDGDNLDRNKEEVFSWVMNNFWDTNFKASLGGFYEFNYHVYCSEGMNEQEKAMNMCYVLNQGITTIRIR